MEALVRVGEGLTKTLGREEQLALAWHFVRDQLSVSTFFVALYDKHTDTLHFPLAYDEGELIRIPDRRLGDDRTTWGIAGYVCKTGQELCWPTHESALEELGDKDIEAVQIGKPCQSCFYFPLKAGDEVLGIVSIQSCDRYAFSPILLDVFRALGSQLTVAMENATLLAQTQRWAADLETLQRLANTVASSLDLHDVMEQTCRAAVEFFRADHSGLVMFGSDSVQGEVVAEYPTDVGTLGTLIPLSGVPDEEKLVDEGEPLVVYDVANQDTLGPVREILHNRFNIHSILIVPVMSKGKCLGTFSLDAIGRPRQFAAHEVELCKMFAAQAAVAMENARLYQAEARRRELLAVLDETSRHIRAVKEPSKLLHEVVHLAARLVGCEVGGLCINRPHLEQIELTVAYGLPDDLVGVRLVHGEGLAGLVARTGEARIVNAYSTWPSRLPIFESRNVTAMAGIPLKRAGEVEAVLLVADTTGLRQFTDADVEILERFAIQVSMALQASRLIGREQRGLAQLAILHRISDYIQAAEDLDKILHVVLTGVTAGYGLGLNRAALLLMDQSGRTLLGCMGLGHLTLMSFLQWCSTDSGRVSPKTNCSNCQTALPRHLSQRRLS
jgi:GAF domain-containing protein